MAVKALAPPQSKTALAERLGIARSALYYAPQLPGKDLALKAQIEQVMSDHRAYGHRRLALQLGVNKKRVRRVMRLYGLKVKRKRKVPKKPEDLGQTSMAIPNLVLGLTIESAHQVWASDFTYLPYFGRWLYLATVEDVCTRQVLGWALATRRSSDLVALALLEAVRFHPAPEIIHSDQGSEYRSQEYLNLLKSLVIRPSMSQKASPWQNGYQESFYSGFKLELGYPEIYPDLGELIEAIAGQIYYYNHRRIHTALKCPPAVFAQRLNYQNQQLTNQEITKGQSV